MDWILNLDYLILLFVNRSLSFSFADWFFPFITDLHKAIVFNLIVFPLTFYVFYKTAGWKKGGLRFFLCLLVIGSTDFFCGSVLKKAFQRPRPPEV
ncbi:MAG: phosphatase PAP2 family protein, partial [Bdellovibrionaceae bacterium]|nr:phosphatase PAP2 family protein [Pseudobdellovibrionaceae bacterium]